MKKILLLLILFSFLNSYSQTEYGSHTLVRSKNTTMTGYISTDFGLYGVEDIGIGSIGFTLAATTNKVFSFGAVGNWILDSKIYPPLSEVKIRKNIGYGGILLEPSLIPSFPLNVTIPVTIGYGIVNYRYDVDYWDQAIQNNDIEKDNFFIFSLGARLQINITNSIRLTCGPSYKITTNKQELETYQDGSYSHDFDLLNGLNLDLSVKLGKY